MAKNRYFLLFTFGIHRKLYATFFQVLFHFRFSAFEELKERNKKKKSNLRNFESNKQISKTKCYTKEFSVLSFFRR